MNAIRTTTAKSNFNRALSTDASRRCDPVTQRGASQENVRLEPRSGLSLHDAAGVEIACLSGRVWITMEGDSRDITLGAGDAYTLERNGLTLVSTCEAAIVNVRSRWDARYARWLRLLQHLASWLVRVGEARARKHHLSRYY